MRRTVRAFAPATVANVCSGFDIFGFALERPGDEVVAALSDGPGVRITRISGDGGRLPRAAGKNTVGVAAAAFLRFVGAYRGVVIELFKNMPLGSGMGSSAASAAAALCAVNELFGRPLQKEELLAFALEAEKAACGAGHADNAAPSLLGGFILVRGYDPLDVVKIPTPAGLFCALVHPALEIRTAEARRVLPEKVPLRDAVAQWGNAAGLVAGLMSGDMGLISRSLRDGIAEPVRAPLIPRFREVKNAALATGALGAGISGSGPALFALADGRAAAERAGKAMQSAFRAGGIGCELVVSGINPRGAEVVEKRA